MGRIRVSQRGGRGAPAFEGAVSREDVEDREFQEMHPGLHNPQAGKGMQVHVPYTVYAHFFLVRQILSGAGVKKVEYSMDCKSLLRGAFLSAWCDEVKQGTAHGFYVRHAKYRTVTEREAAKKEARMRLKVFQDSLQEEQRHEAALMMMHNFEAATAMRDFIIAYLLMNRTGWNYNEIFSGCLD